MATSATVATPSMNLPAVPAGYAKKSEMYMLALAALALGYAGGYFHGNTRGKHRATV